MIYDANLYAHDCVTILEYPATISQERHFARHRLRHKSVMIKYVVRCRWLKFSPFFQIKVSEYRNPRSIAGMRVAWLMASRFYPCPDYKFTELVTFPREALNRITICCNSFFFVSLKGSCRRNNMFSGNLFLYDIFLLF